MGASDGTIVPPSAEEGLVLLLARAPTRQSVRMLRVVALKVGGDWPGQAAGLAGVVQPGGAQFEVALFGQARGHLRRLEVGIPGGGGDREPARSEEHTSELQS